MRAKQDGGQLRQIWALADRNLCASRDGPKPQKRRSVGAESTFGKVAPYVNFSNFLSARMKHIIAIDKFMYQVV